MAQLHGKQIRSGSIPNSALQTTIGKASTANKDMAASVTVADFDLACADTIDATPVNDSYVCVSVNGLAVTLGDGVKTKDCYFSGDSGTTARAIAAIATGDELYWVGSVAGYELDTNDRIDFEYEIAA
jgi:hypothetical protein